MPLDRDINANGGVKTRNARVTCLQSNITPYRLALWEYIDTFNSLLRYDLGLWIFWLFTHKNSRPFMGPCRVF